MLSFKKSTLVLFVAGIVLASCAPKEHVVDCNKTDGTFICFDYEGKDATYSQWNYDTVDTYNVFNVQGSYPAIPGTTGPWTTVNITFVNSMGNTGMELGVYDYFDFLTNSGSRRFTFWLKRYEGDAKDPEVKNFVIDPSGSAVLTISNMDGTGKLTGLFEANVWNLADTTETGLVKFRFTDIPLQ